MTQWLDRCHFGDVRVVLRDMIAAGVKVNCVVTSPPYWGLRDYGHAGQIGLEASFTEFIANMVDVFELVREVLTDDGTCWINMGDSYAGSRRGGSVSDSSTLEGRQPEHARQAHQAFTESQKDASLAGLRSMTSSRRRDDEPIPRSDVLVAGLKAKDLIGQPWRLAFALQASGWWLRQDIIWHKPNPMPESTKDRCTKAHEYIFLLSKSARYFFDHDAIKEPASLETHARYARGRSDDYKHAQAALVPGQRAQTISQSFEHMSKPVAGWATGQGDHSVLAHNRSDETRTRKLLPDSAYEDGKSDRMGRGPGWRERKLAASGSGTKNNESFDAAMAVMPEMAAKRSVWTVPTQSYKGAHFATYPEKLIEPCIVAGCPRHGVVLDPFFGSGTTGAVALRLGRRFIGIELNPSYRELQDDRLAPAFAQPSLPLEAA